MRRVIIATNNRHKLEEIRQMLPAEIELVTLSEVGCYEELTEDRDTIDGNSLQKAEYVFCKFGVACFADDTGLEVDALDGDPGVFSARYAGPQRNSEDNIDLLLRNLASQENKEARFRSVITLIDENGVHQFEGILKGAILKERRGTAGFGYDAVFLPEGFSRTLAEMSIKEKNQISHRAIAVRKLANFLKEQR